MPPVGALLSAAVERLEHAGVPEPRVDAELLLAELLDCSRGALWLRRRESATAAQAERFAVWLDRRAAREPLQHIVGHQEFRGLRFAVDRRALIPRPESEGLVDAVLCWPLEMGARVADLGTGSGCLAVSLAVERPDLRIDALDRSVAALELAAENARRHGVERRVHFCAGEMAHPPAAWHGRMDAVLSNPPYVAEATWRELEPEVRDHDPRVALVPGPDGLEAYRGLAPAARALLRPGAPLLLEIGWGQAAAVGALVARSGFEVHAVHDDLNGIPRVLVALPATNLSTPGGES